MASIWIGDFRCSALQALTYIPPVQTEEAEATSDNTEATTNDSVSYKDVFIIENSGNYYWLTEAAAKQLGTNLTAGIPVILALGFNDCIHCCVWPELTIETLVDNYTNAIKKLCEDHSETVFYICSVNPVDRDYACEAYLSGIISKSDLNDKIVLFNNKLKESCEELEGKIIFIDSHKYLTDTGYTTRDGVRYSTTTATDLHSFIGSYIYSSSSRSGFIQRTTPPPAFDPEENTDMACQYWLATSSGGENPFCGFAGWPPNNNKYTGDTLPNCTAYAWGRFYEIIGEKPTLSTSSAEDWFDYTEDGYSRGDEPAEGAVACWIEVGIENGKEKALSGHVAIVEEVKPDGSVVMSESGWGNAEYWRLKTRKKGTSTKKEGWYRDGDYNTALGSAPWIGSSHRFQGFIYCPAVTASPNAITVTKSQVTTHTGITTEEEREINAQYIYKYLGSRGWTLNAVAGLLGNLEHESWINPGVTELGGSGFGLVQWTPPSKFTRWCDAQNPPLPHSDVDSQLARLEHERDPENSGKCTPGGCTHGYWLSTHDDFGDPYLTTYGPSTLKEFAVSTKSPFDLACAFLYNYERPSGIIWGATGQYAKPIGRAKTIEQREEHRASVRKVRGEGAEKWFKFLAPYAVSTVSLFSATGLKANTITPTELTASILIRNGSKCKFEIHTTEDDTKPIDSGNLDDQLVDEEKKSDTSKSESELEDTLANNEMKVDVKVVTLKSSVLKPNTSYILSVNTTSALDENDVSLSSLWFTTPQARPESPYMVYLLAMDKELPTKTFRAGVFITENWGYWKEQTNKYGYTLHLIVNGKRVKTKEIDAIRTLFDFSISDYFDDYSLNFGDNVQLGVRTWVEDDKGKKIYDQEEAVVTSNAICMLQNNIHTYLNVE